MVTSLVSPDGRAERQAIYYDQDSLAFEPVVGAPVHHVVFDEYEHRIVWEGYSSTDGDGIFDTSCSLAPTEIENIYISLNGYYVLLSGGTQRTEYPETVCLPGTDPAGQGKL